MRWNLRRTLAAGAVLTVLGIGLPAGAAYSQDDPRSCNDLLGEDTPAYVVCTWLATPEEAADIARFWLGNDSENLKAAEPVPGNIVDCAQQGNSCPGDLEGDGEPRDEGDALPDGYQEPGDEAPECDPPGSQCSAAPDEVKVSAAEVQSAAQTPDGKGVGAATAAGLRVWVDTDLSEEWKAGEEQFTAAVKKTAALALQPGVVGIRFASQLGFSKGAITTADEARTFVREAAAALRTAAPGRKLAVHTLVPEFGCGADDTCKAAMAQKYPLLAPDVVASYVSSVDQLSLDSGLARTEYEPYKITAAEALRNQWIQVRARAWDADTHIAAEDAAFTGPGQSQFTEKEAADAIAERVSGPLMDDAAETVTLWTRWQDASGQVYRVMGEKLAANPTWDALAKLDAVQPRLATLYNPATPEVDNQTDLKKLAEAFGTVYVTVP
ncbi:hypothetical protein HNP84_009314 [Thermocatellispora tengchongensis]|uniref:Uncharacterized protein n=1 Tax=Thermocatellispora tengchongensis TaxID=1073253 RepID=A0A840PP41_9ACTN|nr:hypothetical protein [Thermocatellispora tengchongensis]MBB5139551.1 hypothetical protein [Thermocatellispora tengchongensis]